MTSSNLAQEERQPFISDDSNEDHAPSTATTSEHDRKTSTRGRLRSFGTVPALLLLLLLVSLAHGLYTLPLNRIIERRLCREYFLKTDPSSVPSNGQIDESRCKIDEVQRGLAKLLGIMETTWTLGDFLVTIPLGFVAQKYGLRLVLWLNIVPRAFLLIWAILVGYFDNIFPPTAIIVSPFLSILGGKCVFESLTYSLAANLSQDYTKRVAIFSYMSSVTYIVSLLSPALASLTMTLNLFLPLVIGLFLLTLSIPIISRLPSSNNPKPPSTTHSSQPSITNQTITYIASLPPLLLRPSLQNLRLLLVVEFLTSLASSDTPLLIQYISLRYYLPIATAGYLLALKSLFNLLLLTILIPRLFDFGSRKGVGVVRLNYICVLISLGVSIAGVLGIAVSRYLWMFLCAAPLYAMGSALPVVKFSLLRAKCVSGTFSPQLRPAEYTPLPSNDHPARSDGTATTAVKDEDADEVDASTQLYSIVMLTKTLGSLVGAPVMAGSWVQGIKIGGAGLGVPYFVSAVVYAAAGGVVGGMKVWEDGEETAGRED